MRAEVLISLISALGLHAGLLWLGYGEKNLPPAIAEIEIGLDAGDDASASPDATEENVPASDTPPMPEPEKVVETPPPVPQELPPPPMPVEQTPPPMPMPSDEPPPEEIKPAVPPPPAELPKPAAPVTTPAKPAASKSKASRTDSSARGGGPGRGSNVSTARYLFRAPLRYPASALAQHLGGYVVLRISIDEAGRAMDVRVKDSSGSSDLDAAAMDCARASKYEPYRVAGVAQPCTVVAPFQFRPR